MSRFLKFTLGGFLALGLMVTTASAGHDHHHHNQGWNNSWNNNQYHRHYRGSSHFRIQPYPYGRGHWDYHPPEIYRHRNHYHVAPGHYDWHQTSPWRW